LSHPSESSDASKPIVKDKNPHNYRKVGYSMIVISVSLVLIGLLVWAIGDNYHFSSDIMANQEIDAMTPKHGFSLVYYDTAQPVGAKLKLLDAASTVDDAQQKQMQYAQQNPSPNGKVLIFNETLAANQQLVHDTVDAITKLKADQAQAVKDQAASHTVSPPTNQTTSTVQAKQNTTSSSTTTVSFNATKVMTNNPTKATIQMNATVVTHVLNATLSGKPTGSNTENLGISANVTITHSSNATTSNHTKSLSEAVGVTSG
jgi:hypothetical protein